MLNLTIFGRATLLVPKFTLRAEGALSRQKCGVNSSMFEIVAILWRQVATKSPLVYTGDMESPQKSPPKSPIKSPQKSPVTKRALRPRPNVSRYLRIRNFFSLLHTYPANSPGNPEKIRSPEWKKINPQRIQ